VTEVGIFLIGMRVATSMPMDVVAIMDSDSDDKPYIYTGQSKSYDSSYL
jgi:hypothetical protein